MRPFSLNDEEIRHIIHRRALTTPQRDLVDYLAANLAAPGRALGPFPDNVIPLQHYCPGNR